MNLLQDDPPGPDRGPFRCKRGDSGSDQIRIDELQALHVVGQEFAGKGRFPDAIGTGNDIEIRFVRCHHAYPIGQPPCAAMASSTAAIRRMVSAKTATIR